jgi:hypothetical protein
MSCFTLSLQGCRMDRNDISACTRIHVNGAFIVPYWLRQVYLLVLSYLLSTIGTARQSAAAPAAAVVYPCLLTGSCLLALAKARLMLALLSRRQVNADQCLPRQRDPARQQCPRDSPHQPHYTHPIIRLRRAHTRIQVSSRCSQQQQQPQVLWTCRSISPGRRSSSCTGL